MKVGLLIQDLASEYSNIIIKGLKKYCLEKDIQLFVFVIRSKNWDGGAFDYQHIACKEFATKNNVDGIILITSTYCQNTPENLQLKIVKEFDYIPMVSFGVKVPGFSSVSGSMEKNFSDLLVHLEQAHGCKRIWFMGPETASKEINLRFEIFKNYIESKNQTVENRIIKANFTYEAAKNALADLGISKDFLPFDAIVCCNDDLAFGCIDYLKGQGIKVPDDVKITGIDNQLRCDYVKPTLTSIDLGTEEQAYEAVKILYEELENPELKKRDIIIDSKTVYRHSCGCPKNQKVIESSEGKYFKLREQVYQYQYFIQELQATVESEKIKSVIKERLKRFGVKSCVCCLYEHSITMAKNEGFVIPDKAQVYLAYNSEKDFIYDSDFRFNPREHMYPQNFVFEKDKEVIVTVLYDHEYQFGYLIYTPGEQNYNTYELIASTIGISLATNIVFFEKVHETERLASEKLSLESTTYFDEMTGAMNRRGLYKYALPAMKSAIERGLTGGVIFGDLDHLKVINDNYGHEAGDRAIKEVVQILQKSLRPQDIIARLGGDEFVIVACGLKSSNYEKVKARIESSAAKFNEESDEPFEISISLGYVEFTKENNNLDELMKKADEVQYKEKVLHHRNRS